MSKFCTKCGAERKPDAKFCTKCGTPYQQNQQQPSVQQPQQQDQPTLPPALVTRINFCVAQINQAHRDFFATRIPKSAPDNPETKTMTIDLPGAKKIKGYAENLTLVQLSNVPQSQRDTNYPYKMAETFGGIIKENYDDLTEVDLESLSVGLAYSSVLNLTEPGDFSNIMAIYNILLNHPKANILTNQYCTIGLGFLILRFIQAGQHIFILLKMMSSIIGTADSPKSITHITLQVVNFIIDLQKQFRGLPPNFQEAFDEATGIYTALGYDKLPYFFDVISVFMNQQSDEFYNQFLSDLPDHYSKMDEAMLILNERPVEGLHDVVVAIQQNMKVLAETAKDEDALKLVKQFSEKHNISH